MVGKAASGEDGMRNVLKSIAMSRPFLHKNTSTQHPAKKHSNK
jgi:2-iminoacetate synthase ThiH